MAFLEIIDVDEIRIYGVGILNRTMKMGVVLEMLTFCVGTKFCFILSIWPEGIYPPRQGDSRSGHFRVKYYFQDNRFISYP